MQVPQQVLQQMIQEKAELTEAERAGITVSDAEVRAQIMAIPGLQENGQFIGEERYRQLLAQQNPPITPSVFEVSVREGSDSRQVPGWPHRMDVGVGYRSRARVQTPQREGDAGCRVGARRQLQDPGESDRRGDFRALRQEQGKLSHSRPAQDQVRARESRRAGAHGQGVEGRRRAQLQRAARQVHDARADSREPHPADDRRQRRCGRPCRSRADTEAGEIGRRFCRPCEEVFAG